MTESRTICIFGGTGFVGRRLTQTLLGKGYRVTIVSRQPSRHKDLRVSPDIDLRQGNIYDNTVLQSILRNHDVAVNLVGILNERPGRQETFERVHHQLPGRIATACQQTGVERLLHMSSLQASEDGPSEYLKSKARGEKAVANAVASASSNPVNYTIFQPSVIFGPRDGFTRLFANLLRKSPFLPLACPAAKFQPVFVDDVVHAFVTSLDEPETIGQTYQLGGPKQYTLYELVKTIAQIARTHERIMRLGDGLSRFQAGVMQYVPGKPFTPDNYKSMQIDSICDGGFPAVFNVSPTALEDVAAGWLAPSNIMNRASKYDAFRKAAGR